MPLVYGPDCEEQAKKTMEMRREGWKCGCHRCMAARAPPEDGGPCLLPSACGNMSASNSLMGHGARAPETTLASALPKRHNAFLVVVVVVKHRVSILVPTQRRPTVLAVTCWVAG
jgi:hypothetical protein